MKFTSEDLMKAMGLNVGDKFEVQYASHTETFTVHRNSYGSIIIRKIDDNSEACMGYLLEKDYEILPIPKKVGDLKCREYGKQNCNDCPIRTICVDDCTDDTLYNKLELAHKYGKDQEIYDLLKARLDKEVL